NYLASQQVNLNLNLFILRNLRVPHVLPAPAFLAHSALRLLARDASFAALWTALLGAVWREPGPAFTWPALADPQRVEVLAAVEAVVATGYGLSQSEFEYVLAVQPRAEQQQWSAQALERFAELHQIGLESFCQRHDPYDALVSSPLSLYSGRGV